MTLDGIWDFSFTRYGKLGDFNIAEASFDGLAAVPGCFDATIDYRFQKGLAVYRREVEAEGRQKLTIEGVIIPLLPIYIFTMMYEMSATGKLAVVMGTGVKVIATGVVLSILYLVLQYCIAGLIARKNPFKLLWNIVPAYLTGFSICSSSFCSL